MTIPFAEPGLPIDAPERRRLPILLRRAWYRLNQAFRRRIAPFGITPDQFTVLRTLLEHEPKGLIQSELTVLMSSDPNTIASLLERMDGLGWIDRKKDVDDKRAHRIRMKPLGRDKYEAAREVALTLQSEVLSKLPPEQWDRFLEQLATVADSCGEAALASPNVRRKSPRE